MRLFTRISRFLFPDQELDLLVNSQSSLQPLTARPTWPPSRSRADRHSKWSVLGMVPNKRAFISYTVDDGQGSDMDQDLSSRHQLESVFLSTDSSRHLGFWHLCKIR